MRIKIVLPLLLAAAAQAGTIFTYTIGGTYSDAAYMPAELRGQSFLVSETFNSVECGRLQSSDDFSLRCGTVQFGYFRQRPGTELLANMGIERAIPEYGEGRIVLSIMALMGERYDRLEPPRFEPMSVTVYWAVGIDGPPYDRDGIVLVNQTPGTIEMSSRPNPEPGTWWLVAGPVVWWGWRRWAK